MRNAILFSTFILLVVSVLAADPPLVAIDLANAQVDPDFPLQGEYRSADVTDSATGMQVVALGSGLFRVVIYSCGLPGEGWNRQAPQILAEEDKESVADLISSLKVAKVERRSPTLGAAAPSGAVVLFDGTEETFRQQWQAGAKITAEGLLEQGALSTGTFRDFIAHVEFMTPYMPQGRGQGRGNSGIYYQGRYETQVLDSFGLEGKNNETGGIYEIRDPDLNMCFPPLTWQTYDVEFTAPRFEAGVKVANALLTVRLNGVIVQRDVEVPRVTRAAPVAESDEPGPIYIQNHGNPVRFRNIWVLPRNAEREARRPRIPGFERFHAAGEEAASGGLLLVGELGCLNCHRAEEPLQGLITTKRAPVLTEVAKRVRPDWLMQFIANPHAVKPGTTMPNLFAGWETEKRNRAVLALTNFLAANGRPAEQTPNLQAANKGRQLFHEVGCVACHAPQEGSAVATATSVPLADLKEKYTVYSLAEFLKNPHSVRPSGRMPSFNLRDKEPEELAQYLAGGGTRSQNPNVNYKAYHGSWEVLPNFEELQPVKTGTTVGLDLTVAGRDGQFAAQYEAYYLAEKSGEYRFWLGSDDGSALYVDGTKVVDVDGIHPHSVKEGKVTLSQGVHSIRVDYFEQAGEESLTLDVQAPGGSRQDASAVLTLNEDGRPVEEPKAESPSGQQGLAFQRDSSLIDQGRELFVSLGCANCHEMQTDQRPLSGKPSLEFAKLKSGRGCLSEQRSTASEQTIPDYELSPQQQRAIADILGGVSPAQREANTEINQTMVRFNCFACHERSGVGGPEFDRNPLFLTSQPEMGDEGRIPPSLNGVGDKLNARWLGEVLANGANDRPYMRTRMPRFGEQNVGHLAAKLIEEDLRDEAALAEFDEPIHRVRSTGRELVGDQALACIKCHTFGQHRATGIQALSLTTMTKRIREDWFLRYLYEPAKYRPGTRMPTGFPNGQAAIRNIYEGDPNKQISAVWTYLLEGNQAGIPDGLIAEMIELKPEQEPIIYRNFIEGVGPRGIAVGYPEQAHLAWDANELCLKLIWHHRFIDAAKHWVGRGPGNQSPLGDHQMALDPTIPCAELASLDTPWPTDSIRNRKGFQFRGYQLNGAGQPTFRYETPFGSVADFPKPVQGSSGDAGFERTLRITSLNPSDQVYLRLGVGTAIVPTDQGFRVDDAMTIQIRGGETPLIRNSGGLQELLVPVTFKDGQAEVVQRIDW